MSPPVAHALPQPLRILADDLTGALDTAAVFAGAGPVPVFLDRPPAPGERGAFGEPSADAACIAVSTGTRDAVTSELPQRLGPGLAWLRGAGLAYKKVDSLLRGNTLAEVAWLAREGGYRRVLFAPAFPAQGRWMIEGRLAVGRAGGRAGEAVPVPSLPALRSALAAFGLDDPAVVEVPEVQGADDLRRVAATLLDEPPGRTLCCGSAGLAMALVEVAAGPADGPPVPRPPPAPPTLLLSASRHAMFQRQWAVLRRARPDLRAWTDGAGGPDFDTLLAALPRGGAVAFALSPALPLPAEAAAEVVAERLDRLVAALAPPARVVVVGGDTLLALCRATGATALAASPGRAPGWGEARLVDGRWAGTTCASRSGAFGGDDDLLCAWQPEGR